MTHTPRPEQPFEANGFPLEPGIRLLEASAGTGKSFALAQLVLREGCGVVVEPGEVAELALELRSLAVHPARVAAMGEQARRLYQERFGLDKALAAYEALLT